MRGVRKGPPYYEYIMVTADKYELPVFTAGCPSRLGSILGRTGKNISRALSRGYRVRWRGHWYKIIKVEVDEDEYIENA